MASLDRLSQSLTGLSTANAAVEAARIRELLEEQNFLLWQATEEAKQNNSPALTSNSSSHDLAVIYLKLVAFYDYNNTPFPGLLCPFALKDIPLDKLSDICLKIVRSNEWIYDLSDCQRFLIGIANNGAVPPENVQKLFHLMIVSRELRGFGIQDDYMQVWDEYMHNYQFIDPNESNISSASVRISINLHNNLIDEHLHGAMAWYFMVFFRCLHPAANVSSNAKLQFVERNNLVFGTEAFYDAVKGDSTDTLLKFTIKARSGFSFESIINGSPKLPNRRSTINYNNTSAIDPLILKAIDLAISQGLCRRDQVDISRCRFNSYSKGQVVIIGNNGNRIASIFPQ